MRGKHRYTAKIVTLTSALLLASAAAAAAAPMQTSENSQHRGEHLQVKDRQVLSGPTPFPRGCPGARQDDEKVTGGEIEPAITADPAHPRTLIGTWQQDFGFGARSDLIGFSSDGGRSWQRSLIPGLTVCTGGTAGLPSDPWG